MKKLTLNKINFAGATELTREQLKKVMGGDDPATTADPSTSCNEENCIAGTASSHEAVCCFCENEQTGAWFAGCMTSETMCNSLCGNN